MPSLSDEFKEWIVRKSNLAPIALEEVIDLLQNYEGRDKASDDPLRIMVLGLPGAGKGTIIRDFQEKTGYSTEVHGTGNYMADLAKSEYNVQHRDDIRKNLTLDEQAQLQIGAAKAIDDASGRKDTSHLIDCHVTVATDDGYLFGLPRGVFENYAPDAIVYLRADSNEVARRRVEEDQGRKRDAQDPKVIRSQGKLNQRVLRLLSTRSGIPFYKFDSNTKDDISVSSEKLKDVIEHTKPVNIYSVDETYELRGNTLNTTSILTDETFIPTLEDKLSDISELAEHVQRTSSEFSQNSKNPVVLVNNMEGGSVFKWGIEHWASNFDSKEGLYKFIKGVKGRPGWKEYIAHENLNSDTAKTLLDQAILREAHVYLKAGKLKSFVYQINDLRISSDNNEPYYGDSIKTRLGPLTKKGEMADNLKIMIADTCKSGNVRAFNKYAKEIGLLNPDERVFVPMGSGEIPEDMDVLLYDPAVGWKLNGS